MGPRTHDARKAWTTPTLAAVLLSVQFSLAEPRIWNFDKDKTQGLPSGWVSERTGQGAKGVWQVI
ncbi:MAG: hypothetical protein DMG06_27215, partial [Acidobacteria bacterium]